MTARVRPYIFYDVALTICSTCFRKLEGKIVFQDDKVFLLKRCPQHGAERVLIADPTAHPTELMDLRDLPKGRGLFTGLRRRGRRALVLSTGPDRSADPQRAKLNCLWGNRAARARPVHASHRA